MSLTDEQKANRDGTIGSSDAPVVCGVSPYESPFELFLKLHGDLPRYSNDETQAQRIGSRLEPVIAEIAAEELKLTIRRCPPRRHPKHTFMSANLDFEIVNNPKGPGIFEIKNRAGQRPWESLPEDVELQVRHQMAVANRNWGIVAAMFQFGTIRQYEVERDLEMEEYLISIEQNFLVRVAKGEPPTADWVRDIGILKKLYPLDSGQTVTLSDPQALAMADQFIGCKEVIDDMEGKVDAAKGYIQNAMQSASYAEIPGYSCSWKTSKSGTKFDEDAFAIAHPDLYAQFMKERLGSRRFLLRPAKGVK